ADGATTEVETAVESEAEAAAHTRRDEQQVYATRVAPSACACTCGGGNSQLVYALGRLAYDFGTEARRDSIAQHMGDRGDEANPWDQRQMLDYLEKNPWEAASIIWTLNLDATAIYAITPGGSFASEICQRLRAFMAEQLTEGVERVSIPGRIVGQTTLLSGQT